MFKLELIDHDLKEEYSVFGESNTLYCQPIYIDAEVQTHITASDIEVMAYCKDKLENKTQLKRDPLFRMFCVKMLRVHNLIPSLACLLILWFSTFYNQLLKK